MRVRCKFRLNEIRENVWGGKTFVFEPQYDTTIPEDQRFNTASPSGRFEVTVNNPTVIEHYKLGGYYYFDSTPVPAEETPKPPQAATSA